MKQQPMNTTFKLTDINRWAVKILDHRLMVTATYTSQPEIANFLGHGWF